MFYRNLLIIMLLLTAATVAKGTGQTDKLREKAELLHSQGKNDSAIVVAQTALEKAEKMKDTTAMAGINNSLGVYMRTLGKTEEALEHYEKALELCTTESFMRKAGEDERQETASLYLNLATLHIDMQHKKEALYYAGKTEEQAARCNDKAFRAQVLAQNGLISIIGGDNSRAARQLEESYKCAMETGLFDSALNAAAYMVVAANRMGDNVKTEEWRKKCTEIEGKVNNTMAKVAYYQIMCSVEMNSKNWSGALAYFNKILSTEGIDKMPFVAYDCYNNIHLAWAELGEWHKAYDALAKAGEIKDSIFEKDKAESMRELTVKYQTKEKELELEKSRRQLAQTRMYVAIGVLVVLVCAMAIWSYIRKQRMKAVEKEAEFERLKRETERKLTQKYIEGLENERGRLARELHDGVCNDIYTVQLKMASQGGEAAAQAHMLDECRQQVRRISHELMPPEFNYAGITMVLDDYLATTAEASGCKISFKATPGDALLDNMPDSTALEIYRIVQEAVNNSLKHGNATAIKVEIEIKGNSLCLAIKDNGNGMVSGSAGIGKRTMKQRAEAIGGKINMASSDEGTTVTLEFDGDWT